MAGVAAADNQDDDEADPPAPWPRISADRIEAVLPGWVERSVERLVAAHAGSVSDGTAAAAAEAGRHAAVEVGAAVRALLATDVDEQRTNPLAVLRSAVRYPTEVLAAAGVPPVRRDEFDERAFPDDVYGLAPATWSDIDAGLQEPGIVWGAAKAHVVLTRRRREGEAMNDRQRLCDRPVGPLEVPGRHRLRPPRRPARSGRGGRGRRSVPTRRARRRARRSRGRLGSSHRRLRQPCRPSNGSPRPAPRAAIESWPAARSSATSPRR